MAEQPVLVPEKAMVFIDAMNVYESLRALGADTRLDYYKLAVKLAGTQRRDDPGARLHWRLRSGA